MADPTVAYPDWYLHRWHFLPEGYLSRRSARIYPTYVPRLYNQGQSTVIDLAANFLLVRAPARVLELGCGPADALERIGRRLEGPELTGLDLSPFFLEMARDNPGLTQLGANLVHGDAGALQWPAASFEAVFAVHLFGHMPPQASTAALDEAVRVLTTGGRLLVVDHSWHPWATPAGARVLRVRRFNAGLITLRALARE